MVVNIHAKSYMYFSHQNHQICKLIYYAINLDIASSSKVFNEFDYMFLSNVSLKILLKFLFEIPLLYLYLFIIKIVFSKTFLSQFR